MEDIHRLFELDSILRKSRYPVPKSRILEQLECSNNTFKKLKRALCDCYDYPIVYSRKDNGYYYASEVKQSIPGLWFSEKELYALLTLQQILKNIQPGLLQESIEPFKNKIHKILKQQYDTDVDESVIRMVPIAFQRLESHVFQQVSYAVLHKKKIAIDYESFDKNISNRTVSPQRLLYYRDHWYLDGYCHYRKAVRIFFLSAIHSVQLLDENAEKLSVQEMEAVTRSTYGIFSGKVNHIAKLLFSPRIAIRIKGSHWHSQQTEIHHDDGSVELHLPYSDDTELIMDILRYGDDVEVLEPEVLRHKIIKKVQKIAEKYSCGHLCEPEGVDN